MATDNNRINVDLSFNADTKKAKQQIQDLMSSIRAISQNPISIADDLNLQEAVNSARELERYLSQAINVNTGKLDISKFSQSLTKSGKDLSYFQNNLLKLGDSGQTAFLNLAKSIAQAELPAAQLNSKIISLMGSLKKTVQWQLSNTIVRGFIGSVQTAYGYAKDLNKSLNDIRIVTGKNSEQMAEFAARANDAAKALSTSTTNYTNAALIYTRQGLPEEEVEARTNVTIKMANAAGTSAEAVAEQMTAVWNNFYDGSKSLEYYSDVMTALGASTASSTDEISQGVNKFAAVARTVGLSYEYATSALATVTAKTRESADVVGNAFKTLFARIQGLQLGETLEDGTNLNKYSKALEAVGINIKDNNGQLKQMDNILNELGSKWKLIGKDQQVALAETVAGVRQYTQLVALMDNWDFFQQNLGIAYDSEGTLTKQAEIYQESWEASIYNVKAAAQGIYQALIDEDFFIGLNNGFAKGLEGVEGLVKGLGGMPGILSGIGGLAMSYLAKDIPVAIGNLTQNFRVFTGQAQQDMFRLQQESINIVKDAGFGDNKELNAQVQSMTTVAQAKQNLARISGTLTDAEKQENEFRIQLIQSMYQQAAGLAKISDEADDAYISTVDSFVDSTVKELSTLDKKINDQEKKTNDLRKAAIDAQTEYNKYLEAAEELKNKGAENDAKKLLKASEPVQLQQTITDFKNNEENLKFLQDTKKAAQDLGIDLEALSKYNPNIPIIAQAPEIYQAYQKVKGSVEDVTDQLKVLYTQRASDNKLREEADQQKKYWDEVTEDTNEARAALAEYLKDLKKTTSEKPDITTMSFNKEHLDNLVKALENPKTKFDELRTSAQQFFNDIEKSDKGESSKLKELDIEIDNAKTNLYELLSIFIDDESQRKDIFEQITNRAAKAGQATTDLEDRQKKLKQQSIDLVNHEVKLSEAVGATSGIFMSFNSILTATNRAITTLTNKDASGIEKLGAVIGLLTAGLSSFVSIGRNIRTVAGGIQQSFRSVQTSAQGAAAGEIAAKGATDSLSISMGTLNMVMGGITIAIMAIAAGFAIYQSSIEKTRQAQSDLINDLKEQASVLKEENEENIKLIQQMQELLKTYKETGEGKESLDEITKTLAETYNLEGAALAKLSGEYENYQKVLQGAQEKSIKTLKEELKIQNNFLSEQEDKIMATARIGNGRLINDSYRMDFGGVNNLSREEAKAAGIVRQYASKFIDDNYINPLNFLNPFSTEVNFSFDYTIDNMIEFYNSLNEAYIDMNENMTQAERSTSDIYRETKEWIDRMKELIEDYKQAEEIVNNLQLLTNVDLNKKATNINDYDDYIRYQQEIREELENTYGNADNLNSVMQVLVNKSFNPNLTKYYEMDKVLSDILATGTKISKEDLSNIWDKIQNGEYAYSSATIATLNWGILTIDTWQDAANAVQEYNDAVDKVDKIKDLKSGAESSLNILQKDKSLNTNNYEEILNSIPWGDVELDVIEFSDFMKKTYDEQVEYLTKITQSSIIPWLDNELKKANNALEQAKNRRDELIADDSGKTLIDVIQSDYYNRSLEDRFDFFDDLDNYNLNSLPFKVDLDVDINQIKNDLMTALATENLDEWIEEYLTIDPRIQFDEAQNDIDEWTQKVNDLTNELEIKAYFDPPRISDIKTYMKKVSDASEILIQADADFNNFNEQMKIITENDYSIDIAIKTHLEETADTILQHMTDLYNTADKIGDDFIIKPSDIEAIEEAFPGILNGYEVMSDGMIQLNSDVVNSVISTKKEEVQAEYDKIMSEIALQIDYAKQKKQAYDTIVTEIGKALEDEVVNEKEAAHLKEIVNEQLSEVKRVEGEQQLEYAKETAKEEIEATDQVDNATTEVAGNITENAGIAAIELIKTAHTTAFSMIQDALKVGEAYQALSLGDYDKIKEVFDTVVENSGRDDLTYDLQQQIMRAIQSMSEAGVSLEDVIGYNPDKIEEEVTIELGDEYEDWKATMEMARMESDKLGIEIDALESLYRQMEASNGSYWQGIDNILSGKGSDGKKSGSAKEYEPKHKDLEKDADIYEDINNTIDEINTRLEKQKTLASNMQFADNRIAALKEEKKLLEEMNGAYDKKLKLAISQLDIYKKNINTLGKGIEFDVGTGNITNAVAVKQAIINQINAEIDKYNADVTEQGQKDSEQTIENLKNDLAIVEDAIKKYQDTLDVIQEMRQDILSNYYESMSITQQILEENYKKINKKLEIEIKIDDRQLKRLDYYLNKISDDFYSMAEAAQLMFDKVPVIEHSLQDYAQFFNDIQIQYHTGDISWEDYLDGLEKAYDGVVDNLTALVDLDKEMLHYYENTLSAAADELAYFTDQMEHLTKVLDHYKNIVVLVDGEYNFKAINTILQGQAKTRQNELDVLKANYEMLLREKAAIEASMASVEKGSKAWELFYEELKAITVAVNDAEEEMLAKTEEWAETMKEIMENAFAEAAHDMEMAMTQGIGFDYLSDSLDRLKSYQDVYLTQTNELFELQKLMRQAQQDSDKTQNAVAKKRLKSYMDEIDALKNDGLPLSKLDLEIQKARYEILKAELALSEAQNNKSKVRLQRDNEGNYGYIYTADSNAVSQAEQDLANAQNALYNIGLDATNDYGEKLLQLQQQLSDDLQKLEEDRAAGRFATEEEYQQAKERIIREYNDLFMAYYDQYTTALGVDLNIQEEAWINAYQSMIDETQQWQDYTVEYTDRCEQAFDEWRVAVAENNEIIQGILTDTAAKVKEVTDKSDELKEEVLGEVLPAIRNELETVRDVTAAYALQRDALFDLIKVYEDLARAIREAYEEQARMQYQDYDVSMYDDYSLEMAKWLRDPNHSSQDAFYRALQEARTKKIAEDPERWGGDVAANAEQYDSLMRKYNKMKVNGVENDLTRYVDRILDSRETNNPLNWNWEEIKKLLAQFPQYAQGGYTGDWNINGGRMAIVHPREYVLNEEDTKNVLAAAGILSNVARYIDLQAASAMIPSQIAPDFGATGTGEIQQNVHIEASFPSVTDRNEIESAFNDLINTASQYANRKI